MPPRDQTTRRQRLERALTATDQASRHVEGLDYAAFLASSLHQDAVLMQIMQIAENLKYVDDPDGELRAEIPMVGEIIGMRNYIAHQYDSVEMRLIWTAATEFVPQLRAQLQKLLDDPGTF